MRRRWRQDLETGELIEITNKRASARVHIHVDNVDFVSPIDGSRIRNNRELVSHNRKHGVTNDLDSLREQTQKARAGKSETRETAHERKLAIVDAIERASSSGYHRKVEYDE